jgi:hypothetical protein
VKTRIEWSKTETRELLAHEATCQMWVIVRTASRQSPIRADATFVPNSPAGICFHFEVRPAGRRSEEDFYSRTWSRRRVPYLRCHLECRP